MYDCYKDFFSWILNKWLKTQKFFLQTILKVVYVGSLNWNFEYLLLNIQKISAVFYYINNYLNWVFLSFLLSLFWKSLFKQKTFKCNFLSIMCYYDPKGNIFSVANKNKQVFFHITLTQFIISCKLAAKVATNPKICNTFKYFSSIYVEIREVCMKNKHSCCRNVYTKFYLWTWHYKYYYKTYVLLPIHVVQRDYWDY